MKKRLHNLWLLSKRLTYSVGSSEYLNTLPALKTICVTRKPPIDILPLSNIVFSTYPSNRQKNQCARDSVRTISSNNDRIDEGLESGSICNAPATNVSRIWDNSGAPSITQRIVWNGKGPRGDDVTYLSYASTSMLQSNAFLPDINSKIIHPKDHTSAKLLIGSLSNSTSGDLYSPFLISFVARRLLISLGGINT